MYTYEEKICLIFAEAGVTANKFYTLLDTFGTVRDLVENFDGSITVEKIVGEHYGTLCKELKSNNVDNVIAQMERYGVGITTCFSETFPQLLKEINDPPYLLYYRGNVALLKSRCLGVVGTRKASTYGRRVATDFTAVLCEHFTIVSGLAYGIDSIAHETTLKNNGKTIAVLGGGLINVYPAQNQNLAERIIAEKGLLITEYGMNAQPYPYRFPHRNRIVSGLSQGLLVCQAPLKSGTASTVECALQQGRDVFAVPGEIYDSGFGGNNNLIKSVQGVCVTTPRDIESFYGLDKVDVKSKENYQLNVYEQKLVDVLSLGQMTFDQLVQKTGIPPAELNFLLANLEIKSIISKMPGNSYRLYGGIE